MGECRAKSPQSTSLGGSLAGRVHRVDLEGTFAGLARLLASSRAVPDGHQGLAG
jgi:hypothetical protein